MEEREYIVIGGGAWGIHHARLILRAVANARLPAGRLTLVDRDPACGAAQELAGAPRVCLEQREWVDYLVERLADDLPAWIVPSPHAPHIFLDWLERAAGAGHPGLTITRRPFLAELSLPFQYSDAVGNLYLSAAAWMCPVSCREPEVCPAILAQRTWDLPRLIADRCESSSSPMTPVIWRPRYIAPGVAAVTSEELRAALMALEEPRPLAVATASACHGVVAVLDRGRRVST